MSRLFAFLAFAALAPIAAASSQPLTGDHPDANLAISSPPAAKAKTGLLSAAQIQALLVGNTIDGVEDGKSYSEFIASDGRLRGVAGDGPYGGDWRIENNQFCSRIDLDADPEETPNPNATDATWAWDCSPVSLVGDKLFWSDGVAEGDVPDATLRPGDPDHL